MILDDQLFQCLLENAFFLEPCPVEFHSGYVEHAAKAAQSCACPKIQRMWAVGIFEFIELMRRSLKKARDQSLFVIHLRETPRLR